MGTKISRQRYYDFKNVLAVELCVGTKFVGADILPVKYKNEGEGKYLVSPVDAVGCAKKVLKKWQFEYADEKKYIAVVNHDDKGSVRLYDPLSQKEMDQLDKWAEKALSDMDKCGHCGRPIGKNSAIYESDELPNKTFCAETCFAAVYRHLYSKEPPNLLSNKDKKNKKK